MEKPHSKALKTVTGNTGKGGTQHTWPWTRWEPFYCSNKKKQGKDG